MKEKVYIVDDYNQKIEKLQGIESFCYQNCQRILLQFQGIKNPELYLNAALSFGYDKLRNTITTGNGIRSLLPEFINSVNRMEYSEEILATNIYEKNIEYVYKNKQPIIVGVDTYYLEYASNYLKNHARHTLLLCGYDAESRKVFVIDWYPDWYYRGEISLDVFLKARSSANEDDGTMYSGERIGNNWAIIENIKQKKPKELLVQLLEETIIKQYNHTEKNGIVYGQEAISEFDVLIDNVTESSKYQELYKKLNFITKRYKFFKMYIEYFENNELINKVLVNLDIEIDEWDKVSMLILKASMVSSDKIKAKIHKRIKNIMEIEYELERNIRHLYNILKNEV